MNSDALLALIADLYSQLTQTNKKAAVEIASLEAQLANCKAGSV